MDGYMFYFLSWIGVIILQVFYKKKEKEAANRWTFYLLILMIVHPFQFTLFNRSIYFSYVFLLIGSIIFGSKYVKKKRYYVLQSFCMAFTICIYQIMVIYDPVWTSSYDWMIYVFITVTLTYFLGRNTESKIAILFIGTLISEVFLTLLLGTYGLYNEVGTSKMNVNIFISFLTLVLLEEISTKISRYVQNRKSERKEMQ